MAGSARLPKTQTIRWEKETSKGLGAATRRITNVGHPGEILRLRLTMTDPFLRRVGSDHRYIEKTLEGSFPSSYFSLCS
jgi:hypothetical protein